MLVLAAHAMLTVRHALAADPHILEEPLVFKRHASGRRCIRNASGFAFVRSPRYANAKACDVRPR